MSEFVGKRALNPPSCSTPTVLKDVLLRIDLKEGVYAMPTREQKQNKTFAEKLLRIQGKDYEDWLDAQHQLVIQENQELILEALDSKLNFTSSTSTSASRD